MKEKGLLIVLEGIDGCGGETQIKLLEKHLGDCLVLSFPAYGTELGNIVDNFLHKRTIYDNEDIELLIYFTDILQFKEKINEATQSGKNVICDRYITSTLVYQSIQSEKNTDKILTLIKDYELPIPDITMYLDITPEESQRRKIEEKQGYLDRNEENKEFLEKVRSRYLKLAKLDICCRWKIIDGMQNIDKVHQDIINAI